MARARSPDREKAFEMWRESDGKMLLKDIADALGLLDTQIRKWKNQDRWEDRLNSNVTIPKSNVTNRAGAPKGNKNAVGNKGGAAPKGNSNAVTHGFFRKFFPEETLEIMEQIETRSPIDMLWDNIVIQYTAIIRAQRLMFVQDQGNITKEVRKNKSMSNEGMEMKEQEWEIQFAWDKHATFLHAQSRAMSTLQSLIRQYEDMCNKGLATEEQRLRIEKLKAEVDSLRGGGKNQNAEEWTTALLNVAERRRAMRESGDNVDKSSLQRPGDA